MDSAAAAAQRSPDSDFESSPPTPASLTSGDLKLRKRRRLDDRMSVTYTLRSTCDVFELRVHIGPGYRVYFAWEGPEQVLLLGGGSKATQATDIVSARQRLIAHREKVKH